MTPAERAELLLRAQGGALADLLLVIVLCHDALGELRDLPRGPLAAPRALHRQKVADVVVVDAVLCKLHPLWPHLHSWNSSFSLFFYYMHASCAPRTNRIYKIMVAAGNNRKRLIHAL